MTTLLCGDDSLKRWPFVYDEDDEGVTVWHDSGRAARWELKENNSLSITLFLGSDPWVTTACLTAKTEEDALAIVKSWCEDNKIP